MKSLNSGILMLYTSLCILCVTTSTLVAALSSSSPIVDLGYAKYRGSTDYENNITSYLGIRYAAPPLGDLRWRAPQPPIVHHELQDAIAQPPMCIQGGMGRVPTSSFKDAFAKISPTRSVAPIMGTEDCLFLNVFAPSEPASVEPLPAIIWIHGGGFHLGDAASYPGQSIVRHGEHGVIVVLIQYRLGLFGFLAGKEVKEKGALNAGLLDQEFALKWVQEHISKFGGDPNQVTLWGESAGGNSIIQHLIAHDGKTTPPLFHRAIPNSPSIIPQFNYNDPEAEMIYDAFVRRTDCSSAADTLACLRSADVSILASANSDIANTALSGTFIFAPVVDGEFITQSPVKALQDQKVNPITAILSITTADEGRMFTDYTSTQAASEWVQQYVSRMSKSDAERAGELYKGLGSAAEQRAAMLGEHLIVCPNYYLLRGVGGDKSFKGTLAIPPGLHAQDMPYYFTGLKFGSLSLPPVFESEAFKKAFVGPHLAVARFSDPNIKSKAPNADEHREFRIEDEDMLAVQNAQQVFNPNITATDASGTVVDDILPKWEPFSKGNTEMWFGKTEDGQPDIRVVESDPALLERCRFWESISALTPQ